MGTGGTLDGVSANLEPTPPETADGPVGTFEAHRALLTSIAYRMLGQLVDAEDVVQEAWLRWARASHDEVRDPRAFLVTVTSRLALDRLRRIAARRETYTGEWLPEPVAQTPDPADAAANAETVAYGLLVVLESLSPLERVVYVLREAFDVPHAEIAQILDRSEPAIRQLASRARSHVAARHDRFEADEGTASEAARRFLDAARGADLGPFLELLAPDVELVADAGGQVRAPLLPVRGSANVGRFLEAVRQRSDPRAVTMVARLNGAPGIVVRLDDAPAAALLLEVSGGAITRLYLVGNPEKLGHVTS
jgi:RNA polymerase sigma-70 factor (ECF subfamily)